MLVYEECFNTVQIAHACLRRMFQYGRVYLHFIYNDIYIYCRAHNIHILIFKVHAKADTSISFFVNISMCAYIFQLKEYIYSESALSLI